MFAQVTCLQHWKSEHNEQTCEDACGENRAYGLFAVADGAGTTLFSGMWAKILVQNFLAIPLMSAYPFEVEWWVRQAQEQFKREAPDTRNMAWNAAQKAQNQGSHTTLAALRILDCSEEHAQAELLAFGDSCILICNPFSERIQAFPLDRPADFEQPPICVPSKLSVFNRYFHQCRSRQVELTPSDVVVLATDAVARWIISAGAERYTNAKAAFLEITAQTPHTWAEFVTECRNRGEMNDDDSTALILTLDTGEAAHNSKLGATSEHNKSIRESRKMDFENALRADNKELIAIMYGDGVDLNLEGIFLQQEQIQQARKVADAMRDVLQALRQQVNSPDAAAKLEPIWHHYAPLLLEEPCAANLRQTLARLGVPIQPSVQHRVQPSTKRDLTELELANLRQEREQLDLERHFVQALRADDDNAILTFYNLIQQSRFAQNIIFSPQEQQRINLAYQRAIERQRIQATGVSAEQRMRPAFSDDISMASTVTVLKHQSKHNQALKERRPSWLARFIRWWREQNA